MDPTPDIKNGVQTTEFWLALGNAILNFVATFVAIIHPGFHIPPGVQAAVVAFAPLAAMGGTIFYALSRGKVKAAAVAPAAVVVTPAASTTVINAATPTPPAAPVVTKEGDSVRGAPRRASRTATRKT